MRHNDDMLKRAREAAGLSQAQLAKVVGVKPAAIGLIETGDTKSLKASTAVALARALGLRVEWLVEGVGATKRATKMSDDALQFAELYDLCTPAQQRELLQYAQYVLTRPANHRAANPAQDLLDTLLRRR